jgi:aspartate/methionine/tyrosine aminotransferase
MNRNISFSRTTESLPQALSVYMNQLLYQMRSRGRDVTALSLGEAYFSIPKFGFGEIDFDRGYHYSDSQGIPELRKKIAEHYGIKYNVPVEWDSQVLISTGSKLILFMCMKAFLNPGDGIAVHEPAWLSYSEQAKLCEANTTFIPHFAQVKDFEKYLDRKSKILIINNPNNPAGKLYSIEELQILHELCVKKNMILIVDEAYSDFVDNQDFTSIGQITKDFQNLIIVNSLSKNMGMSGWRIGYMLSNADVIKRILRINQHLVTCAPTVLQLYLAKHFNKILEVTEPQIQSLMNKREDVQIIINSLDLECLSGSATFYFFVDLSSIEFSGNTMGFALHLLLNHDICVVPGGAYGNSTDKFVRLSIGTESVDRIRDALIVIKHEAKRKISNENIQSELRRLSLPEFRQN